MTVKRVITIKGVLPILDFLSEQIERAAFELGYKTYEIDINNPDTYGENLYRIIDEPGNIVYSFNQVGLLITLNGDNFWDKHSIPFISHIVDHPINYADAFENPINSLIVNTMDYKHADFIRGYFPLVKKVNFVPNGGTIINNLIPYENRQIDIIYIGSCASAIDVFPSTSIFQDNGKNFINSILNILYNNSFFTIEEAINIYCDNCGFVINEEHRRKLIMQYHVFFQRTVVRHYKLKVIRALQKTGRTIHIYGNGWENNEETWLDNVVFHEPCSAEDGLKLLCNSKIGLNIFSWFKAGCNERVFNIMANGAICLTDTSEYLTSEYSQGKEMVFYELDNMDDLVANVNWLLDNPEKAANIAERGRRIAVADNMWTNRLTKTIESL